MNKYSKFFDEIFSSPIIIQPNGLVKYIPYLSAIAEGKVIALPEKPILKMSIYDELLNKLDNNDQSNNKNGVAVIPISGVMTRSGSWWDYGTDEIAQQMIDAFEDSSIVAVVLRSNTPGGTVDSIFPLKAAFSKKNKPVLCAVDSQAMSCGYYAASFCDRIFPVDNMASVGSIGVMANITDWSEYYNEMKIKVLEIVPPESSWKNRAFREAKAGKPDLLIQEELTPWAQHFQSVVRANRPNLNESIEGTLEGRTFFANYGEINAKVNGLIDDVMPMDDIISYAFNMSKNQQLKKLFNS